jgi:hypothetical protein
VSRNESCKKISLSRIFDLRKFAKRSLVNDRYPKMAPVAMSNKNRKNEVRRGREKPHKMLFFGSAGMERRKTAHPKASIDNRKKKYASPLWNFIGFVYYKSDAWSIKKPG